MVNHRIGDGNWGIILGVVLGMGTPAVYALPSIPILSQVDPYNSYTPLGEVRYLVYLNGNSALLLDAIRRFVPAASLQQYGNQTVIQAGVFEEAAAAQEQAQLLQSQGFQVQIDSLSASALNVLLQPPIGASQPAFNPLPVVNNGSQGEKYLVYVDTDNPANLARVQRLVPNAVQRTIGNQTVLQVGAFGDRQAAETWRRTLTQEGIYAKVGLISTSSGSQQPLNTPVPANFSDREVKGYYVVIPGNSSNLSGIADRLYQVVGTQVQIQQRNAPFGTHLALGPFRDRREAEQWNTRVRGAGIKNARIYFSR